MELKTLFTIFHLFGVAIGAGGAFISDAMFFSSVKDEYFSKTEIRFLRLGSKMVWLGLVILILSGAALYMLDTSLMYSSKFQAKMTIILVILFNGLIFHLIHIPRIARHMDKHLKEGDEFIRKRPMFLFSGVVSLVSWSAAIVLGAFRSLEYTYGEIMFIYTAIILVGVVISYLLRDRLLPHEHARKK